MRLLLRLMAGLGLVLLLVAGLALWKPVAVSRVVWPVVELVMLREPFKGITVDGEVQSGLFKVAPTGVSTKPIVEAANVFLASLDESQRQRARFDVDDSEWRRWANIHVSTRQGVGLLEMDQAYRDQYHAPGRSSG